MKKLVLILGMIFTINFSGFAQEIKKNKNAKVEFHVSGNCEMCKKRIQKAALSVKGVKSADWHLDCGTIYLIVDQTKTTTLTIQNAIAKVGHDNDGEKSTNEDYSKLHHCCLYRK